MRKTRVDASAFVFAIVSIAYPLLAAFLIPRLGPWPIILILVGLLLARSLTSFAKRVPAIMTLGLLATAGAMAVVAAFDAHLSVRLYPVLMNAAMLTAFTHTLFNPPSMIERFARIMEPDLPESGVRYTRRVTMVWAAFFVINGAIALWTALYADWRTWSLYNGVIAYVAMGVLFAVEFAVRQVVREEGPGEMNGLIATLLEAPAERVLFGADITAGRVRAAAAGAVTRIEKREGPVFIFTESAALCTAALLAAAVTRRSAILLPQAQPGYLAEIGCEPDALLNDDALSFGATDASLSWAPADADIVFYTSGSTGRAKAVEKKLSQIEAEARMWERGWSADAGAVLATVSHQHIYGLIFRIVWPVLSGRVSSDRAAIAWEELEGALGARSTFITSPAHLTRLPASFAFADGGPPKLVFSSGGLLPLPAAREAASLFGLPVMEVLGSTETGGVAWRRRTDDAERWRAFEGVEVSAGEEGLMRVCSAFAGPQPVDMGDIIKIDADGAFSLAGRGDRVAKVEGKRVSLPAVEAALKTLPDVADAAVLTLDEREGALAAVVALSPAGRDALDVHGAFRLSRMIRRDLATSLEPAERPKHWRFVDEIPTNAQSKRVMSDLAALFGEPSAFDLLDCEVLEQSADAARVRIRLDASLPWFEGHFPDRPILPGIAQVHIAAGLSERLLGFWPVGGGLTRVKFRRVLRPNDVVILTLKRDAKADRLEFVYAFGDIDASQGVIGG